MKILAIDPGYERMGMAVLEGAVGKEQVVFSDCVRTKAGDAHASRLVIIGKEIGKTIEKYAPEAVAVETLFLITNQKTAMMVSEARGVILCEAARHNLPVYEYTPLQIKIAVTGYGRGDKKSVIGMVKKLVNMNKPKALDDEYDAIAVGLTHFASHRNVRR